jgi:hypothetical protein
VRHRTDVGSHNRYREADRKPAYGRKERIMSLGTILLIILVLMLFGAIPTWPHSKSWGYGPSGLLGVVAIVLVIMLLTGRL